MFNFFVITAIATAIASITMSVFVFFKNKRVRLNQLWALVGLGAALWSLSLAKIVTSNNEQEAIFWNYFLYLGSIYIPVLFYHFSIVLLGKQDKRKYLIRVGYILSTIFLCFVPTSLFIKGAPPKAGFPYWLEVGIVYYPYVVMYIFYVFGTIWELIRGIKENVGFKKDQVIYVLFAALIGFGGAFTDFLPQLFNIYPFGHFFVALYIIAIGYAITRYRLMDIKTIVRKSTIFTSLVVSIGAIFIILSSLISYFINLALRGNRYADLVSAIIVSIIIASIFQPLRNMLEAITNKFLFTKAYSLSDLLSKINQTISSTIDLNKLLKLVSNNVDEAFHFSKIGFAFVNKVGSKERLKVYYQSGFAVKELENFSKGKIDVLPQYFSGNKEIKVIDELKAQYEAHEYQPKNIELLNGLYDLNISLVIPLFTKEKLIGVIVMGNKKSDDPYNSEDLRMLNIIAGQLGIAIENARLYEEQKNFNVHLKDEVQKATLDLEKANKELKRLDDAKSEFLSIASHQLRTPLTITKGYVSMMNEGSFGKIPKIIKENLVKIYAANERLLNLVENLLDISRIEAGRLEFDIQPVDLSEAVKSLVADFQGKANDKKLKLEFYPEENLPKCSADAQKIKEVISNLIDNSIKYTKKGEIIVGTHQEGQSVVFTCQDTGMGIEPEDLPRLFNKFVRGKGMMTVHTEGTGLGLYFARVVIENMGGRIWTESPGKDRGSKFSFSLPMVDKGKAKKIVTAETIKA